MEIWTILLTLVIILGTYIAKIFLNVKNFKTKLTAPNPAYVEPDTTNRFSKSKIPKNIDYIIIGSGTSGLTSAATLSKLGKKVLVLEQHDRLGGCFHTFEEKGFEFDTGFHYVGNTSEFKGIIKLLSSKPIEWTSHLHYDTVQIGKEQFKFEAPFNKFFENLIKYFPEEEKIILKYKSMYKISSALSMGLTTAAVLPKFLGKIYHKYLSIKYSNLYKKSTTEIFNQLGITKNTKLSTVLCGIHGDIGLGMDDMPFIMHTGLLGHYAKRGSMYPKKSTNDIIKGITSTIVQNGGVCLTKAKVSNILVENGQVKGVVLNGGAEILCKKVISTMGIPNTIESVPNEYKWQNKYEYSESFNCYTLFLGLNAKDIKVPSNNTWYIPKEDSAEVLPYQEYTKQNLQYQDQKHRQMFISFATAKQGIETDKHCVSILSEAKWSQVEKFRINEVRREKEYAEFKQKIQKEMQDEFLKLFPQFEDRIEYSDLATPLTNETYYNRKTPYGLSFSIDKQFDFESHFKVQTKINGLYLSGQDTIGPGFITSLIGGIITTIKSTGVI